MGLDVQSSWQPACYLPVCLCKLKTSHDILADNIISSALGKQLGKENRLKQKCLVIKIAISGNGWAGGAPGVGKCHMIPTEMKKKTVKWLFQVTATAISVTLYYASFSTGNALFSCTLLPMNILLMPDSYRYVFWGKPLIMLRKKENLPFRYICILFIMSPLM